MPPCPPWVDPLRAALAELSPPTMTLATVDMDLTPPAASARTVVIRALHPTGQLLCAGSATADKARHLRGNPSCEAVIYLPELRQQYRISGTAHPTGDPAERLALWQSLSDSARALFCWPPSGGPVLDADRYPRCISVEAPVPDDLQLLVIDPQRVDHLDLRAHPHRRTLHRASEAWQPRSVSP